MRRSVDNFRLAWNWRMMGCGLSFSVHGEMPMTSILRRIPWRRLFLAVALGAASYVGCMAFWPAPKPNKTFDGPWPTYSHGFVSISPDGALIAACGVPNQQPHGEPVRVWVLRMADGKKIADEE